MSIRLERLTIRNIGPLQELRLEPSDLTVVHGPNEAGKTSCIDAHHSPAARVSSGRCSGPQSFHHSCVFGSAAIFAMSAAKSVP